MGSKKKGAGLINGSFVHKTQINESASVEEEIAAFNYALFELSSKLIKTILVK